MSFAEKFLGKPPVGGVTPEMLELFLRLRVEENVNLDYKSIEAFHDPDSLSKAVCAFANGAGGLIILGVSEEKEVAKNGTTVRIRPGSITWGDASLSRERLEQLLVARVHPWVDGIRIHPVRTEEDKVVFLIDVPQSLSPPHQAGDKRYYLRYNFESLPMEHYQVEALFGRRSRPDMRLKFSVSQVQRQAGVLTFQLQVKARNKGRGIAKYVSAGLTLDHGKILSYKRFWDVTPSMQGVYPGEYLQFRDPKEVVYPDFELWIGQADIRAEGDVRVIAMVVAEDSPRRDYVFKLTQSYLTGLLETKTKPAGGIFPLAVREDDS